jgi:hypothetical protein
MDKREARKEFKSRLTPKGVFALQCTASKELWVSGSNQEFTAEWIMVALQMTEVP